MGDKNHGRSSQPPSLPATSVPVRDYLHVGRQPAILKTEGDMTSPYHVSLWKLFIINRVEVREQNGVESVWVRHISSSMVTLTRMSHNALCHTSLIALSSNVHYERTPVHLFFSVLSLTATTTAIYNLRAQGRRHPQRCRPKQHRFPPGESRNPHLDRMSLTLLQPSQGADGESEYADDAMEEDELISEDEEGQVRRMSSPLD